MKGTLHKTEQGWVVEYAKHSELPLYPDDVNLMPFRGQLMNDQHIMDGKEVDFEIVIHEETSKHYAKLIPSKEQQKQLITEIMDLDAKDGLYDTVNEVDADFPIEHKLASVWVFDTNASKWSNNDDTAGDNHASFIAGYRKAKETLYTEEQVREAINLARVKIDKEYYAKPTLRYSPDEIIQSLKQPKNLED